MLTILDFDIQQAPNGLRYWFGELRTNFANGQNQTYKLALRRRRKPNPVHAMLGVVYAEKAWVDI